MPNDFYFSLACNPCNDVINYKIANKEQITSILLRDVLGNEVSNLAAIEGLNSIPVNAIKNGVYTISLKLNSGKLICKKLVIAN